MQFLQLRIKQRWESIVEGHDNLCPYPGDMYDDYDCQCILIKSVRDDEKIKLLNKIIPLPNALMVES